MEGKGAGEGRVMRCSGGEKEMWDVGFGVVVFL